MHATSIVVEVVQGAAEEWVVEYEHVTSVRHDRMGGDQVVELVIAEEHPVICVGEVGVGRSRKATVARGAAGRTKIGTCMNSSAADSRIA